MYSSIRLTGILVPLPPSSTVCSGHSLPALCSLDAGERCVLSTRSQFISQCLLGLPRGDPTYRDVMMAASTLRVIGRIAIED